MSVGRNHQSTVALPREITSNRSSAMWPRIVEIKTKQQANDASAQRTLNPWIVMILIFMLFAAVFLMELHLRKLEHRSLSLRDVYTGNVRVFARQRRASVPPPCIHIEGCMCWNEEGKV
jgi:hypothetical protein